MPAERLSTLRHQRALVASHLAWLDAEIAALAPLDAASAPATPTTLASPAFNPGTGPILGAPQAAATDRPSTPPATENLAAAHARADEILARYATTARTDPAETRKGCLLMALVIFCIGWLALLAIYFVRYQPK